MQQLRVATKLTTRPPTQMPTPNVREEDRIVCRTRQNPLRNENVTSSFAQRECDVITAHPIAQKALSAFASVNRRHAKLGSVLLCRTQLTVIILRVIENPKMKLMVLSRIDE